MDSERCHSLTKNISLNKLLTVQLQCSVGCNNSLTLIQVNVLNGQKTSENIIFFLVSHPDCALES